MRTGVSLLCIILLVMGNSCKDSTKIPSGIIPKDKMENLLWDMMLADRYSAQFLLKDSATKNVKLETMKLYEQVFQLHKISRQDFVKSYKYYLNRPDISKVMFDSLSARGSRNRDHLYKNLQ
jgi:hypothetical protein